MNACGCMAGLAREEKLRSESEAQRRDLSERLWDAEARVRCDGWG